MIYDMSNNGLAMGGDRNQNPAYAHISNMLKRFEYNRKLLLFLII